MYFVMSSLVTVAVLTIIRLAMAYLRCYRNLRQ